MSPAETASPRQAWSRNDLEAVTYLATLIEARMAHEISLIGHRMAWLVVSESFMFSAYAAILSSQASTNTGDWLMWVLPVLGIVLVVLVWPGIREADKVMQSLGKDREKLDDILERLTGLGITRLGMDRTPPLHKSVHRGRWPLWVPPILAAVWAMALAARLHIVLGPR